DFPAGCVPRSKILKRQTGVFSGHPICVKELAVRPHDPNQLRDQINQLLEFLFRTLTLSYVYYCPNEFNEFAGPVEHSMSQDVYVPDAFVRMKDSVVHFEIRLVADGFLEPFPGPGLIIEMNSLKEFFESRERPRRIEAQHAIAFF